MVRSRSEVQILSRAQLQKKDRGHPVFFSQLIREDLNVEKVAQRPERRGQEERYSSRVGDYSEPWVLKEAQPTGSRENGSFPVVEWRETGPILI